MADKIDFLRQHPIFTGLTPEQAAALDEISEEFEYEDGAVVAYQGDVADCLYLVRSGRLYAESRAVDADERSFVVDSRNYMPGDYFGEIWLFEPDAHVYTIQATSFRDHPARLVLIKSNNFLHFLDQHPEVLSRFQPRIDTVTNSLLSGLPQPAWEDAQKVLAKAERRSAAISILPDELVEYSSRRSGWYLFVKLFWPVTGLIIIPAIFYLFFIAQPVDSFLYSLRRIVPGIFAFFFFVFAVFRFLDWTNDYFVVTNRRLVHREFDLRTFRVDIKTARINQVQSVEIAKPTFISNLFNFGTARVTTASQFGTILFDNIDDPIRVKETLDRLSRRVKTLDASREQTLMRQSLEEHFEVFPQYKMVGKPIDDDKSDGRRDDGRRQAEPSLWTRFQNRYMWRVEEENSITYRRHVLVLFIESIIPLGLAVLGLLSAFIAIRFFEFTLPQIFPFLALFYALDFLWLIWQVEDWRNDIFQLTDRFIVDIDRRPFGFGESRKQAALSNIQNVNAFTPGLIQTLFNFGYVEVETAGEESNIVFENVPYPSVIQSDIFQQLDNFQELQRQRQTQNRHKEFSVLLDVYKQSEEQKRIPRRTPTHIPPVD